MPLSSVPAELVYQIVSQTSPPDGWGKYWPSTRAVDEVKNFLALRLVCKEFDNIVLDYLSEQRVLIEDFDSACLQRSDPPTPAAVRMCWRLLTRHVERSRAGARVNEASLAFAGEMIKVVDTAVTVLRDGKESPCGVDDDNDIGVLRETYTQGVASAVIGFSGITRAMLEGIAGTEREANGEITRRAAARDQGQQYYLNMALTTAATLGRIDDMKILIGKGADPAFDGRGGWLGSPLHGAAIGGSLDAIRFLTKYVDTKLDVECSHSGNTLLHYAAQNGNHDTVRWLLGVKVYPDERNDCAQTPLFLAASGGHADIVKRLLNLDFERLRKRRESPTGGENETAGFDAKDSMGAIVEVEADDFRGRTPMMMAVQRGYLEVVKELMRRGDLDINNRNGEEYSMGYLATAASKGYEAVFRHLLSHRNIKKGIRDGSGHGILKHAAVGGNENIVREVLKWRNVDVNLRGADDSTPIMWAALYGNESIVRLLIENGAAVDLVSSQMHLQLMRLLSSEADAAQDEQPDPQLMMAMMGEIAVLVGASALDAAAHGGHEGTVKLLISQPNIALDRRDLDDRTPLANAALTGHEGVVKLLLAQGDAVDPEAQDKDGCTPLILAARAGDEDVVKVLLQDTRIAISRTDKNGYSALAYAAKQGHEGVVKLLLKVVHSKREIEGALVAARECAWKNICTLLTSYLQTMPEE
ncbi:ankyrin repeat-containing domain protein [Aspergillus granulosus]|uniref:Ankyrin repeat-containing domain protein n=1 Tax=Aspergillus granulosus TaxID=176169 RepID=A0ABR4H645_9EURO